MFKSRKWAGPALAVILLASFSSTATSTAGASSMPTRIISLSPSATEILFAIGAGSQVVAVDDNSDYPKTAPFTKLSSFTPNIEAIAAYRPDLVVLQSSATNAATIQKDLQKLKINVYLEVTPTNITDAYSEFLDLGKVTGHPSRAKALVLTMKAQITEIVTKYRKKIPTPIFHELDNTLYSADSTTFIGQIYSDFNFTNIADAANGGGYPQLSAESVIKANPKIIFLDDGPYGESTTTVASRPGWAAISAVKSKHVIVLPLDIPDRWGPRIVDFYRFIGQSTAKIN